jgi:pilus assembly protein CpaC
MARRTSCLLALAVWLASATAPGAGTPASLPAEVRLFVGDSHVLHAAPRRVAVGNGAVVSATSLDSRQILLIGESPGRTTVQFWFADGARHRIVVDVLASDLGATLSAVRELLHGVSGVSARAAANRVVLEGTAADARAQDRATAVAALYPGVVLNFVGKVGLEAMVHFDVRILEVRQNALRDVGIRWRDDVNGPNAAILADFATNDLYRARPPAPDVADLVDRPLPRSIWPPKVHIGWAATLDSRIRLLEQQGDAHLIAEPTLSCRSGGSARFVSGGELPIPVIDPLGGADIEYREYGVILDVKPVVDPTGLVLAEIDTEVSQIDESQRVLGVPALLKRRATTQVNLREGETLVIAGLVNRLDARDRQALPGLGRLPVAGRAFGTRGRRTQTSELAVFITPRLVAPAPGLPPPTESASERYERLQRGPASPAASPEGRTP